MFIRGLLLLSCVLVVPRSVNGQATKLDGDEFAGVRDKVVRSEAKAAEKIERSFPDERGRLRSLLNKMKQKGPFSLSAGEFLFVRDNSSGRALFPHMVLLVDIDATALPDSMTVEEHWRWVPHLSDALNLDAQGLISVMFMNPHERIQLVNSAFSLTVGESEPRREALDKMKQNPLLRDRILDYLEGEHTRTHRISRFAERELDRKAKQAAEKAAEQAEQEDDEFAARLRTWHDKTGKYSIEAAYVGYEKGVVKLQKGDRTLVELHISKLSLADQKVIRKEIAAGREKG